MAKETSKNSNLIPYPFHSQHLSDTTKANSRAVHLNLTIILADSLEVKKRFIFAYDVLYEIKAWLVPEHFDMLHVLSNNLYWQLGDLCVTMDTAINRWDQLVKAACFADDIATKQMELSTLTMTLNSTKDKIGNSTLTYIRYTLLYF